MLRFATIAAVSAAALSVPAHAATTVTLEQDGDTYTGEFTGDTETPGAFTQEFNFDVPFDGVLSTSIVTIAVDSLSNIDFSSVMLNDMPFNLTPNGDFEYGFLNNVPVASGPQTITVNGTSGGNAAFGGTISFTAGAVPEPGIWALMILGFGLMGGAMRRSGTKSRVRANVNFA